MHCNILCVCCDLACVHIWSSVRLIFCVCQTFLNFKITFPNKYVSWLRPDLLCIIRVCLDPTAWKSGICMTFDAFFYVICNVSECTFISGCIVKFFGKWTLVQCRSRSSLSGWNFCTCGLDCNDDNSVLFLFSPYGKTLDFWPEFPLDYWLRSVIKHVLTCKNLIMYFVFMVLLFFVSTRSTITLQNSFVYMGESPFLKCKVGILDCVDSLQIILVGLTRIIYNLCETASLMNSFSACAENSIGLPIIGSSFDVVQVKTKKNVESV